jgi:hypothetical protein
MLVYDLNDFFYLYKFKTDKSIKGGYKRWAVERKDIAGK